MPWLDLIPRTVLAGVIAALAALCVWQWSDGLRTDVELAQAGRDYANAQRDVATLMASVEKAKAEAAEQARDWQAKLSEAERNARTREKDLRAAADAAGVELDGLRGDVAALRGSLEGATAAAAADRAAAVADVFGQCSRRYTDLAARCDRHVNDIRTLIDGWPK